ncbi:uncharacterized protein L201_004942 [Kwoniella dendrophila CBS 6074]|uniref:Carotenoid oxygenase n=1 Tax=Kwoniella dendrophila CBS 6074 TaxID=1295534 RepID=A0AAX4JZ72_9TREE
MSDRPRQPHTQQPHIHPFLKGNFAPVINEYVSHPCKVVHGEIPPELVGGQYIRNGGNPVYPPEQGRHYHWFDGDGMLHGVFFGSQPMYTNRQLATPLLSMTLLLLRSPLPSIALLISPLSSLHRIVVAIIQAFFIAVRARMGVLSVANTSVIWWGRGLGSGESDEDEVEEALEDDDQRLLATCESGPPLEVRLPELQTVGWDRLKDADSDETLASRRGTWQWWKRYGLSRVQEDWITAHPRVDPIDGSLILYSTQMFDAPHVRYSVIDRKGRHVVWKQGIDVGRAKMMHDFAATRTRTILLNLPLTLAPHNLFSRPPVPLIHFDRSLPSEFVIFPRLLTSSQEVVRFQDPEPSLIFHTANAWDELDLTGELKGIHMLGCRFRSAKLVYAAGAVDVPLVEKDYGENDVVRLQYYRFDMEHTKEAPAISHSFPLSAIPFEFPTLPAHMGMSSARYVYGCTMQAGSFDERLGGAAKVDCIAKIDVLELIQRGQERGKGKNMEPVDSRSSAQILADWEQGIKGPIELFRFPQGWYAQEPRFVPKEQAHSEDDGYLLTYVYDEVYLESDGTPSTAPYAGSELWVIDARNMAQGMSALVARIKLPQRVPYGLHGTFVPASSIRRQRGLCEGLPPQDLLQDQVARSRLQHFVSIVFNRPMYREKSRVERIILAVMLPVGLAMFALAVQEAVLYATS